MDGEKVDFVDIFDIKPSNFEDVVETPVEAVKEDDIVETIVEPIANEEVEVEAPPVVEEEVVEEETPTPISQDESYYQDLMQSYLDEGVFDIEGDEIEADFSEAGLKDIIAKTVSKRQKEAIDTYKQSLGEKGAALLDIIEKGGEVDDFINMDKELDFSTIPLEQNGQQMSRNQQALIEDWLSIAGYSDAEIDETLSDYLEAGGKMVRKQAELAQRKLVAWQKDKNEKLIADKEAAMIANQETQKQQAVEFRDKVVGTSEIAGFKLSKQKATALYDFITKTDKDGVTPFQKADTEENQLLYAYFAMEGFNKDKLTKDIASKQTRLIKKKLSQYTDQNTSPKRSAGQIGRSDQKTPDIHWNI